MLDKGVILTGEGVISVADIDFICLGLRVLLPSMETARESSRPAPAELSSRVEPITSGMREELWKSSQPRGESQFAF